jgi:hypothetical protein
VTILFFDDRWYFKGFPALPSRVRPWPGWWLDESRPIGTDAHQGVATAPSKDAQRTLDEIARALRDEDPKFVSTVNFGRFRRRRIIVGGTAFNLGMIALVGEMVSQVHLGCGRRGQRCRIHCDVRSTCLGNSPDNYLSPSHFPLAVDLSVPRPAIPPILLSAELRPAATPTSLRT